MEKLKFENVFASSKLTFIFMKILGFACFSIKGDVKNGQIKTTVFDYFLFAIFFSLSCFALYFSMIFTYNSAASPVTNFGVNLLIKSAMVVVITGILLNFLFRHKIWMVMTNFYELDLKVLIF